MFTKFSPGKVTEAFFKKLRQKSFQRKPSKAKNRRVRERKREREKER